jgi:predicted Zn-dependent protease
MFRVFCLVLFLLGLAPTAQAQQLLIRDAEIEGMLRSWSTPLIRAAGLDPQAVKLILVQSNDVNAFVAGGQNIFLYTGLLLKAERPEEILGVIAHELGHIAGGHLVRGTEEMNRASYEVMLGTILGIGAAAVSGSGQVGAAVLGGSAHLTQRRVLAFSRTQESAADQAGLRFMTEAGVNPMGLATFMQKLADQELLPTSQQNEYLRTHPLSRDRVATLAAAAEASPLRTQTSPEAMVEGFARMRAKLIGFITPQQVLWAYPDADRSIAAETARTIAAYRLNQYDEAVRLGQGLISREPKNPFVHELLGQIHYDQGRIDRAVPLYARAVELAPREPLLKLAYAQALAEQPRPKAADLNRAADLLGQVRLAEPRNTRVLRLLATIRGAQGAEPEAQYWLAEEAFLQNRHDEARRLAERAAQKLPADSPIRRRVLDLTLQLDQVKAREQKD